MTLQVLSLSPESTKLKLSQAVTYEDINGQVDPLVKLLGDQVYANKVLIDMSESDYIDSSGVGWLVASHKKFKQAGGKMVLHSFQPQVQKILSVLQMHHVLNLRKDEKEAGTVA